MRLRQKHAGSRKLPPSYEWVRWIFKALRMDYRRSAMPGAGAELGTLVAGSKGYAMVHCNRELAWLLTGAGSGS